MILHGEAGKPALCEISFARRTNSLEDSACALKFGVSPVDRERPPVALRVNDRTRHWLTSQTCRFTKLTPLVVAPQTMNDF